MIMLISTGRPFVTHSLKSAGITLEAESISSSDVSLRNISTSRGVIMLASASTTNDSYSTITLSMLEAVSATDVSNKTIWMCMLEVVCKTDVPNKTIRMCMLKVCQYNWCLTQNNVSVTPETENNKWCFTVVLCQFLASCSKGGCCSVSSTCVQPLGLSLWISTHFQTPACMGSRNNDNLALSKCLWLNGRVTTFLVKI